LCVAFTTRWASQFIILSTLQSTITSAPGRTEVFERSRDLGLRAVSVLGRGPGIIMEPDREVKIMSGLGRRRSGKMV
jgi:hypothetical protein